MEIKMLMIRIIIYVVVYIIGMPILTIIHELGHVTMALLFCKGEVGIIIGDSNLNNQIKLKRLRITFNGYKSILGLSSGFAPYKMASSNLKNILIFAGGPLASLGVSALMFITLYKAHLNYTEILILNALFWYSFGNFFMTIIPMKYNYYPYKGCFSDGYRIMQFMGKKEYMNENKPYNR